MPVQEACREMLAKSDAERRAAGACSLRCSVALHVAQQDVCYDGAPKSHLDTLKGAPLSGAGSSTISELQLLCPSTCSTKADADLCVPAFAADADQTCPGGCRDALRDVAAVGTSAANTLCKEAKPGFLQSALTLCKGGCHKYHPVYESVTHECADELAEDASEGEGGGSRRGLQGGRVGDAGHPSGASGSAERQRATRARTCSLDCQESLAALNRSVLPSMCDDAPLAAQLTRLETRCASDAESVRCVTQFEHMVDLCSMGLSMSSLSSWPSPLLCSSDCHGTIAFFKSLRCFDSFEAVAQTSGGDHLREAWTKLQLCSVDKSRDGNEGEGGRAAHITPPLTPPRPSNQPFPPPPPPPSPRNGGRHRPPPPTPPSPRPPPLDFERLRGVAYGAGYYAGCRVLLDRNGNGREDGGEPANTTATAASGHPGEFSLRLPKTARMGNSMLMRLIVLPCTDTGAETCTCTDTGTGAPARVQLFAPLPAPSDTFRELTISPISSLLAHFPSDVTAAEADTLVRGGLGLRGVQVERLD